MYKRQGLSGTYNTANMVIADLKEKYPERKIICVDTLCASVGEGFIVCEALRLSLIHILIGLIRNC